MMRRDRLIQEYVHDPYFAGGEVLLEGAFLKKHGDEVANIVKNTEETEKEQRPLERIIDITACEDRIEVKTTYEHLARRIGEAVHRAFKGESSFSILRMRSSSGSTGGGIPQQRARREESTCGTTSRLMWRGFLGRGNSWRRWNFSIWSRKNGSD